MSFAENNQRVTNPGGPLELLEITNPSFSEPMRIVNDTVDWVSQGLDYIGLPFKFTLPEDNGGSNPQMQLSVSNIGLSLTDELEQIPPGSITMARLIIVDRLTPNVHEHVFWLPLARVSCTPSAISATAGVDSLMRQAACRQVSNQHTIPGIF